MVKAKENSKSKTKPKDRKSTILDAARRIISKSGIQGATLRAIAEEAEISTGAIYHYFSSKEEILYALMDESLSVSTRIASIAKAGEVDRTKLIEEISENVQQRFKKNADNRVQFYLAQEAIMGDTELTEKFKIKYEEWTGRTDELLKILYKNPPNKYDDAVSSLLIGAIDGAVMQILLKANKASIEDLSKVYDLLLREGIPSFLEKIKTLK